MPESYEKGEEQKCPICGAPYYAECVHMKHPEKFADIKGKPAKIQLGTEGPETEEALAAHKELVGKIIPGEITAEELGSDIETALEKLTEDDRSFVASAINEAIAENLRIQAVQDFLKFEEKQPELPSEIKRVKPVRESLIDSISATFEKLKHLHKDPESLKKAIKKAAINRIQSRAEQGMFKMRFSR